MISVDGNGSEGVGVSCGLMAAPDSNCCFHPGPLSTGQSWGAIIDGGGAGGPAYFFKNVAILESCQKYLVTKKSRLIFGDLKILAP